MIYNSFIISEIDNNMSLQPENPTVSETLTTPETGVGETEVTAPVVPAATEEVSELENVSLPETGKDPKPVFDKLRGIAETEEKARKEAEKELARVKALLGDKEKQEAEAKGEYERLYREAVVETATFKREKEELAKKLSEAEKNVEKQLAPYIAITNEVVDELISDWDDEAKGAIEPANKSSALQRWADFKKIKPLVKSRKTAPAAPGAGPTPKPTSEPQPTGDEATIHKLRNFIPYGG